ncbi:hypothetical protein COCSADRAFT_349154 [Bipolaris sorokiniana ND90Pr]|uniref:Cytochrome P450 n=1 Tax=Cochliobolus sativus (strain ND90Pr / ATCC 201652) TaxID=665912 RepID=M2SL35_COCSN|nr:uncharacterized protein COCSADRAFT_349154 [Bipolaris sorokiniana ND90Pr]EMD67888.1 hypothetical protein COCSADRAFT_349154 [Bipolaris sorokiniana ND90Pr]
MLSLLVVLLGLLLGLQLWRKLQGNNGNLPPGPKPLPIIGNVRDLPPSDIPEYQHWLKFKDLYGPISSISLLGQPIIFLHEHDAVRDLLVRSSKITSSRPSFAFADMCGFGALLNLLPYNSTYRLQRQMIHKRFGTKTAAECFKDAESIESHRFLLKTLDDPTNLLEHVKSEASAIILRITYGYSIIPHGSDPLVSLIEETMDAFGLASDLLTWPVNALPFLKHLPEGFPGTSFKKTAREWSKLVYKTLNVPYDFVRQEMAKGTHIPSYVSSLIEQDKEANGEAVVIDATREDVIKKTAAVMYGGGSDTTVASIHAFILAMILFPEVQKKAQKEIDTVVGGNRLPQFEDRDQLPYINAVVNEIFRWHPVAPLAIPHKVDEEISYRGFQIPKGAYIIGSVWWLLNDPQTYSNPSSFDPDRFLEPRNEPDPTYANFGFGRRTCPGRFVADQTLFITVARMLAVFDIRNAVDKSGKEIIPQRVGSPGLIMRVRDFPFSIRPRNEQYVYIIRSFKTEHPEENHTIKGLINV